MKSTSLVILALHFLGSLPVQSQWVQTNGPSSGQVECLAVQGGSILAGSAGYGVYVTSDNGNTWNNFSNVLGNKSVMALAVVGDSIFAGCQYDGMYLSTDGAVSWTPVNRGITNYAIQALAVKDTFIFAGTQHVGVYRSSTRSIKWDTVNSGLANLNVKALAVFQGNLVAGTNGGGVFWSTNNGETWSSANNGLSDLYINSLAAGKYRVYAGTFSSGVFRLGGGNVFPLWSPSTSGLSGSSSINALTATDSNAFAGTQQGGVYLSTNLGEDWSAVNTASLTNLHVLALAMTKTALLAGTLGGGVFRRPLLDMGIIPTDVQDPAIGEGTVPERGLLDQNYPNPFNPSTTIKYELSKSSEVRLSVYDELGREVSVLVNERMEAGVHEIMFDASRLSSGAFFYRLTAGTYVQTRKLLLLK